MHERDHWPITAEDRRAAIDALGEIIASDDWTLSLRAVRLLLQMDEVNYRYTQKADNAVCDELADIVAHSQ